jgi:hypothetical protein
MVAVLEQWVLVYVKLAAAYPQFSKCKPTEWACARMQSVINRRLREPDLDGAVAFCLITISGAAVEQKAQWRAPDWMYSSPQRAQLLVKDPTSFVIREEYRSLARRLEYALQQAIARMELNLIIAAGEARTGPSLVAGNKESELVASTPENVAPELKIQFSIVATRAGIRKWTAPPHALLFQSDTYLRRDFPRDCLTQLCTDNGQDRLRPYAGRCASPGSR